MEDEAAADAARKAQQGGKGAGAKRTYFVNYHVKHAGKYYPPESTISLTAEEAAPLLGKSIRENKTA